MAIRNWWQTPILRREEEEREERRATWLELFFDLIFVVVVAEMAHTLGGNPTRAGVFQFILLFIPLWWTWIGSTYYNDRFETNDMSDRVFHFVLMLGVAGMGFYAHHGMGETSVGFALSYILCRIVITYLWWWGGHYNPEARPMTNIFVVTFSLSAALWTVSIFMPLSVRFTLWVAALALELGGALATMHAQSHLPPLSPTHLPERFGIFTILVLREPIAGVLESLGEVESGLTLPLAIDATLGLLLALLLWWIYFDQISEQPLRKRTVVRFAWGYLHLPLTMGITTIGAAMLSVYNTAGEPLADPIRWLLCSGIAATLFSMAILEWTFDFSEDAQRTFQLLDLAQWASAFGVLALAWLAGDLRPVYFLILLLTIVGAPVLLELILTDPKDIEEAKRHGDEFEEPTGLIDNVYRTTETEHS